MSALFWQELLLIIIAVVIGMMIGCFLRRIFSTKAAPARPTRTVVRPSSTGAKAPQAAKAAQVAAASPDLETKAADTSDASGEGKTDEAGKADTPADEEASIDLDAEEKRIAATLATLPKDATDAQKADAVGSRPNLLQAPRRGQADDLKRIKGVGKVIEGKLNNLGIHHFDQVANWSRDEVNWVTTFLSFKGRIDREEWIPQAKGLMGDAEAVQADTAEKEAAAKAAAEAEAKEKAEAQAKAEAEAAKKAEAEKAAAEKAAAEAEAKKKAAAEKAKAEAAKSPKPAAKKAAVKPKQAAKPKQEALSADDLAAEEAKVAAAIAALPKDATLEEKANAVGKKPRTMKQARKAGADDLKRIKGVGKVIEGKLNNLGIYHFDQVAKWNRDHINWVSTFLSFKGRIDREDWINQAIILASGEETEFSKRVDKGDVESSK